MKPDLRNRADIQFLVDAFYKKALEDERIGHFFTEVVQLSFEEHLPVIYDFWESLLFGTMNYKGNPMLKHIALDQKQQLRGMHFEQWKKLFFETIDEHFEGKKATEAKQKATNIAHLMLFKIKQNRGGLGISILEKN